MCIFVEFLQSAKYKNFQLAEISGLAWLLWVFWSRPNLITTPERVYFGALKTHGSNEPLAGRDLILLGPDSSQSSLDCSFAFKLYLRALLSHIRWGLHYPSWAQKITNLHSTQALILKLNSTLRSFRDTHSREPG